MSFVDIQHGGDQMVDASFWKLFVPATSQQVYRQVCRTGPLRPDSEGCGIASCRLGWRTWHSLTFIRRFSARNTAQSAPVSWALRERFITAPDVCCISLNCLYDQRWQRCRHVQIWLMPIQLKNKILTMNLRRSKRVEDRPVRDVETILGYWLMCG